MFAPSLKVQLWYTRLETYKVIWECRGLPFEFWRVLACMETNYWTNLLMRLRCRFCFIFVAKRQRHHQSREGNKEGRKDRRTDTQQGRGGGPNRTNRKGRSRQEENMQRRRRKPCSRSRDHKHSGLPESESKSWLGSHILPRSELVRAYSTAMPPLMNLSHLAMLKLQESECISANLVTI